MPRAHDKSSWTTEGDRPPSIRQRAPYLQDPPKLSFWGHFVHSHFFLRCPINVSHSSSTKDSPRPTLRLYPFLFNQINYYTFYFGVVKLYIHLIFCIADMISTCMELWAKICLWPMRTKQIVDRCRTESLASFSFFIAGVYCEVDCAINCIITIYKKVFQSI